MSAAMQQYPNKRVVLLIDDPPTPKTPEDAIALKAAQDIPGEIEALLNGPRQRFEKEKNSYNFV